MPPHETEIKLEGDARAGDRIDAVLVRRLGPPDRVDQLVSRYYDTEDQDLRRAGLTLRVRQKGDGFVQTVKRVGDAAGGLYRRDEWETAVPSSAPDLDAARATPAGEVLHTAARPLRSVFRSKVERQLWTLTRPAGVVEMALDRGDVASALGALPFLEIELELKHGELDAVFEVLRDLPRDASLTVGVLSKSERGFQLLDGRAGSAFKAEAITLRPGMASSAGVQAILRSCLRQIRLNEPGTMARNDKALHQARVGLRRLRSALSLFADLLHDGRFEDLRERLRTLSGVLGDARNLDVMIAGLSEGGEADGLRARLASRRAEAYDRVIATLANPSHAALMVDLLCWIEAGDWLGGSRGAPIEELAADALRRGRRHIRRRGRHLDRLSPEKRHRVRIAGKKLRYATQFVEALSSRPRARRHHDAFTDALESLQDTLGHLNDRETAKVMAAEAGDAVSGLEEAFGGSGNERHLLAHAATSRRKLLKAEPFWNDWR